MAMAEGCLLGVMLVFVYLCLQDYCAGFCLLLGFFIKFVYPMYWSSRGRFVANSRMKQIVNE